MYDDLAGYLPATWEGWTLRKIHTAHKLHILGRKERDELFLCINAFDSVLTRRKIDLLQLGGLNLDDASDWYRMEAIIRKYTGLRRGELVDLRLCDELPGYIIAAAERMKSPAAKPEPAAATIAVAAPPAEPKIKPLTDRERFAVLALLSTGTLGAMTGEKVIEFMFEHFDYNLDLSTLTSAIFRALRANGIPIENRKGAGYFIPDERVRAYLAKAYQATQPAKTSANKS